VDVLDSGPGVPPEDREEIFAPFFSTRRSGGLGLGLTVSRGLMERMGGSLKLVTDESHELPGALFRLSLPEAERL
jgi:signal transduction histidine kinase